MIPSARVFVFAVLFAAVQAVGTVRSQQGPAESEEADVHYAAKVQEERGKLPVLVMLIGAGARFRNIHLDVGDGSGGTERRSFDTGAYLDFGWHFMARPWARRSMKPPMQAMVLQIDGGSGIGLEVEPENTGITLQTNTWRLLGQLGYLHPFERLQVGGLLGVGGDVLHIDLNSVLPSSRIVYVRLGPAFSYEIVSSFLALRFDFGLRFPFALGDLSDAFGDDSSAFGLDAAVMLGGRLDAGFSYAFRFVWEYYRLRFSGATMDVPSMGDGGRGTDHALTFQVLLGWSL